MDWWNSRLDLAKERVGKLEHALNKSWETKMENMKEVKRHESRVESFNII